MKFVIFHGAFGSPDENWIPYLKENLESLGHTVLIPQFPIENYDQLTSTGPNPIPKHQTLSNWLLKFEEVAKNFRKNEKLCFIGHSLGPIFILHAVSKFNIRLDSAFFVCPFFQLPNTVWQYHLVNKSFYTKDFNFVKLQKLIPVSYVLYSDNDPYVSPDKSLEFAEKLGSKTLLVKNAGHFNVAFDKKFKKFPLLLENIKLKLSSNN